MQAGTLALLDEPAEDTVESFTSRPTALDVRGTQEYLDGARVQHGLATSDVEQTTREITVAGGGNIEVNSVPARTTVATEWVADVTDAGFVAAASTAGSDPTFPFNIFRAQTRRELTPARLDVGAFVDSRDDITLWMSGSKVETGETQPNDASMEYGREANQAGGNVGVGFETGWEGTTARGVLYASGYVAAYNSSWGPMQFAQFVRDVVLPVAEVPEDDESEQATLGDSETCAGCDRETELNDDDLCIVCQDRQDEEAAAGGDD